MGSAIVWILSMHFPGQLIALRKERGFTQQSLADAVGIHVNQIKRYEGGTAQPTLEALVKLAKALRVSLDRLVFAEDERGPSDDLRLQFEAVANMPEDERRIIKELLEGMIIKYEVRRWERAG